MIHDHVFLINNGEKCFKFKRSNERAVQRKWSLKTSNLTTVLTMVNDGKKHQI